MAEKTFNAPLAKARILACRSISTTYTVQCRRSKSLNMLEPQLPHPISPIVFMLVDKL